MLMVFFPAKYRIQRIKNDMGGGSQGLGRGSKVQYWGLFLYLYVLFRVLKTLDCIHVQVSVLHV